MKVVITGSQSFIGKVLETTLTAQGHEVFGVDSVALGGANSLAADIRDPALADRLPEMDAMIHLAAISREPDCAADPRLAFDVNVTGTANLLMAARKRNARQVIFASSEWVYGDVANDAVQSEDTVIDPAAVRNEYAATKLAGEMALNVAVRRGLEGGTVLRFGIVYGPRKANWSAVEALVNTARTSETVTVGSLATARRFIHVRDIASGIGAALGRRGFEIFNLAGDRLVTLGDVIEAARSRLGKQLQVTERDASAISIRNPVNDRVKRELRWAPQTSLETGVAELLEYFREGEK
jgi:nucleoside-diphosphate-sugar epimerase